jgi:hypothetical protein
MKAKLGRTTRAWVILLLVLICALLVAIVWVVLAGSRRGPSISTTPQAADLSHALREESPADTAVKTPPQLREPGPSDLIRPQRTVPIVEAPAVPRVASPVLVAEPTPDTVGRAKAAIVQGMRGVNAQASRPADGGQPGTN